MENCFKRYKRLINPKYCGKFSLNLGNTGKKVIWPQVATLMLMLRLKQIV